MSVADLLVTSEPAASLDVDVIILAVQKTDGGPRLLVDDPAFADLASSLAAIGITGGVDEVRRLPAVGVVAKSIALVGLGSSAGANDLRYAAGSVARQLRGAASIALALPAETRDELLAVLEGAAIGAYSYTEFRSKSDEPAKLPASSITVVSSLASDSAAVGDLIHHATVVAKAMHDVRDLVNEPPSHLYPEVLAEHALELTQGVDVSVDVLGLPELEAGDFGGIIGVGQGSIHPPRLVKVTYSPAGATKHLALVGKGITFDSGGISLKPPASMVGMKYDMTGAATILAVAIAAAQLKLNVKVTAWLCIAENMPSGSAIKPNDVLRMKGGKTVEVLNTDAEGRLVMADGIVAASDEHPDAIVDVATLTGAQVVALGNRYSGAMGDGDLVRQITTIAGAIGEHIWHMPLPAELKSVLASDVADLVNTRPGNTAAGMLLAGVFLSEFVGSNGEGSEMRTIPWAHLDIAGPSENKGAGFGFTGKGPTGVTVRTLIALAEEFSER